MPGAKVRPHLFALQPVSQSRVTYYYVRSYLLPCLIFAGIFPGMPADLVDGPMLFWVQKHEEIGRSCGTERFRE